MFPQGRPVRRGLEETRRVPAVPSGVVPASERDLTWAPYPDCLTTVHSYSLSPAAGGGGGASGGTPGGVALASRGPSSGVSSRWLSSQHGPEWIHMAETSHSPSVDAQVSLHTPGAVGA